MHEQLSRLHTEIKSLTRQSITTRESRGRGVCNPSQRYPGVKVPNPDSPDSEESCGLSIWSACLDAEGIER